MDASWERLKAELINMSCGCDDNDVRIGLDMALKAMKTMERKELPERVAKAGEDMDLDKWFGALYPDEDILDAGFNLLSVLEGMVAQYSVALRTGDLSEFERFKCS